MQCISLFLENNVLDTHTQIIIIKTSSIFSSSFTFSFLFLRSEPYPILQLYSDRFTGLTHIIQGVESGRMLSTGLRTGFEVCIPLPYQFGVELMHRLISVDRTERGIVSD